MNTIWKKRVATEFNCSSEFDLARFFVEEDIINEWEMCGLPNDQFSYESAAIVLESSLFLFIVDPEEQAIKWIKNVFAKKNIKSADYHDPKWISVVEASISKGYPVLVQNMNPSLNPILKSLLKAQKNQIFTFNNKELRLNPGFSLFLATRVPDPCFSPLASKDFNIINFTLQQKGLEDQLLPLIIQNERPDLEVIKEKLVKGIIDCQKKFSDLEDQILKLLNAAHGSLLDDEILVQKLQEFKSLSLGVELDLTSNKKTEIRIDKARDEYRPCSKLASVLYFVLADMTHVSPIYIFTLNSYLELFLNSIQKSPKDPDVSRRIKKINIFHQFSVYRFACRCILQKHALLFVFHMCTQIMIADDKLDKDEYKFFIHGGQNSDENTEVMNPCSQWLPHDYWTEICQLELLPKFLGIIVSFNESPRLWYDWYSSSEPEHKLLPGNWRSVCTEFEKLLIIRCLRPDRIRGCICNFVSNNLGRNFLVYPDIDIKSVFEESSISKPVVLFTISPEEDPESTISSLAKEFGVKYRVSSPQEGHGNATTQLIVDCIKSGDWAFIPNCHQAQSWLPILEKLINKLQSVKAHKNFRLWLSSAPIKTFPLSIFQNSIVVSIDKPKGIQANMMKLYDKYTSNLNSDFSSFKIQFKFLLYSLSLFHSILLGRKHFQNLGWNSACDFSFSDFMVSSKILYFCLNEYKESSYDAIKKMTAEITYANHFSDKRDKELMMDYFNQYICNDSFGSSKYLSSSVSSYVIPEDGSLETYLEFIKSLPNWDAPDVFGQHNNAEIPCQIYDAQQLLENMSRLTKKETPPKNFESEILTMVSKIKHQVPSKLDEKAANAILNSRAEPYNYILVQEVCLYNFLLNEITETLQNLENVMLGKKYMTEKLIKKAEAVQKMEVPHEWQKIYPSLKPLGSWIEDLKLRIHFFSNWISASNLPIKIWLPAFTNPISLLNATLLNAAKNSDIMLKDLMWEYYVSTLDEKHIYEAPPEGIYIRGIFLEGAGWDKSNSILTEPDPLQSIIPMPVILFKPVTESSIRGVYNCPCFYTSKRTDEEGNSLELFSIDLRSKKGKEHWRKRSTGLLLSNKM